MRVEIPRVGQIAAVEGGDVHGEPVMHRSDPVNRPQTALNRGADGQRLSADTYPSQLAY